MIKDDLPGAAGAGQQHIIGRPAIDELAPGILVDLLLLHLDIMQIGQGDIRDVAHRLQIVAGRAAIAMAPAEGSCRLFQSGTASALRVRIPDSRRPSRGASARIRNWSSWVMMLKKSGMQAIG